MHFSVNISSKKYRVELELSPTILCGLKTPLAVYTVIKVNSGAVRIWRSASLPLGKNVQKKSSREHGLSKQQQQSVVKCILLCLHFGKLVIFITRRQKVFYVMPFAELGSRQHCRDNVTMLSGQNTVDYGIMSIFVGAILHWCTETFTFSHCFSPLYCRVVEFAKLNIFRVLSTGDLPVAGQITSSLCPCWPLSVSWTAGASATCGGSGRRRRRSQRSRGSSPRPSSYLRYYI